MNISVFNDWLFYCITEESAKPNKYYKILLVGNLIKCTLFCNGPYEGNVILKSACSRQSVLIEHLFHQNSYFDSQLPF